MTVGDDGLPVVLHYMKRWLPLSEPFVYDLLTHSRARAVVCSSARPENLGVYPYRPLVSLSLVRSALPVVRARQRATTGALMLLARRYRVGVVHVHHGYTVGEVSGLVRRMRLPLVLSLHGHDVTGIVWQRPGEYRRVAEHVTAVIVPSRFLLSYAVEAGFPPERVHVIPSGVDTSLFVPTPLPDGPQEVLFVGRFVEKKGLDVLIRAWPLVRTAVPQARLRILGYGPLESLARSAGDGVDVVLRPGREDVREALRRAYLVVSPSRTAQDDAFESLLVVNLEAQASGRPLVTTRHGGIPEFVVDGTTALVVPEADAEALAEAMIRVLRDRPLGMRLAGAGPSWVERFDVRRTAAEVDELYRRLWTGQTR